jgi:hypothetical protein
MLYIHKNTIYTELSLKMIYLKEFTHAVIR